MQRVRTVIRVGKRHPGYRFPFRGSGGQHGLRIPYALGDDNAVADKLHVLLPAGQQAHAMRLIDNIYPVYHIAGKHGTIRTIHKTLIQRIFP